MSRISSFLFRFYLGIFMNKSYRVIFNHATGVYQCVSEFAKAKGKTKSVKLAIMATALITSVANAQVVGTDTDMTL